MGSFRHVLGLHKGPCLEDEISYQQICTGDNVRVA